MSLRDDIIVEIGKGPRTLWWIAHSLNVPEATVYSAIWSLNAFVEPRGVEYLYPQTDRRDGVRRKRGQRLKTWTATRMYYALTDAGRVLLPLNQMRLGAV